MTCTLVDLGQAEVERARARRERFEVPLLEAAEGVVALLLDGRGLLWL